MNDNEFQAVPDTYCSQCGSRMWLDDDSYEPETRLWHYYKCPNCGHTKEID